ncbi:MAG: hypothetical protein HeimC2_19200 [Candidatus Heimdallarchaeota archaeon LC_2]|nr:MAG: hypothetical protein HeimC2_19200 [Candidatus Heimdallarchaeota archaeon LC_2]
MTGLTLLNIDRERSYSENPLEDIRSTIADIQNYCKDLDENTASPRLVPLRNKIKQLQDSVSQFGSDGRISVVDKQNAIMELHPDLMMLSNDMILIKDEFSISIQICLNFLLNHLCSTAASDPKSRVIGVSNVMAQVLSNNMQIIPNQELTISTEDPRYFDIFSNLFNSMLTTAGLFAAPVLNLPDIPISALGSWADQALEQFAFVNQFVKDNFNPEIFYRIDQRENGVPFDTTTDILNFYVYENQFLSALIARADLLSGLEFKITADGEAVQLQSVEEITNLLAQSIERNCDEIENVLSIIDRMYIAGKINRNEKPDKHPNLITFTSEAKIWREVAKTGQILVKIFTLIREGQLEISNNLPKLHDSKEEAIPPLDQDGNLIQKRLQQGIINLQDILFEMFPQARNDEDNFIQSSDFTKFKEFLLYVLMLCAANDILLQNKNLWIHWLINKFGKYLLGEKAIRYNPIGSLQFGTYSVVLGLISNTKEFIVQGILTVKETVPHLEFQLHHLLAAKVMITLIDNQDHDYTLLSSKIPVLISEFLQEYEVNPNSLLYQKASLYLAMLTMYLETDQKEFLRKQGERFVAFDLFSWIQVPKDFKPNFPYMPLNTSLDNLNSG